MASPDFETIRNTINAVDLALSGVPADVEIENDDQFAFGVLDGARVTLAAFEQPTLTVGELFDNHIEGDVKLVLGDHDRVLGMLAGSVALTGLLGRSQTKREE